MLHSDTISSFIRRTFAPLKRPKEAFWRKKILFFFFWFIRNFQTIRGFKFEFFCMRGAIGAFIALKYRVTTRRDIYIQERVLKPSGLFIEGLLACVLIDNLPLNFTVLQSIYKTSQKWNIGGQDKIQSSAACAWYKSTSLFFLLQPRKKIFMRFYFYEILLFPAPSRVKAMLVKIVYLYSVFIVIHI